MCTVQTKNIILSATNLTKMSFPKRGMTKLVCST